jgi:pyruvate kinase
MRAHSLRRTRIIATAGPNTDDFDEMFALAKAGTNVFRLNFSHAKYDWAETVVNNVRSVEKKLGRPVGVMMDTQGPSIRTGELATPIELKPGQTFTFTVRGEKAPEGAGVDVNYDGFVDDLQVDAIVLVDNGIIRMKVLKKERNRATCEVLTPGTFGSRRHINLPGVHISLPSITDKDFADIRWGVQHGVDFVCLSFIRSGEDVEHLRGFLSAEKSSIQIFAKIECQEAVNNFDGILEKADGVMVARGDLGVELPFEELPIIQRRIVAACLRVGKPVIVATQLLDSMCQNPMPTRAEVTDVACAIFEQADALMLSGETTVGRYPVQCIEALDTIGRRIEQANCECVSFDLERSSERQRLVSAAVQLAKDLGAAGIVVFTRSGTMAHMVSRLRPRPSQIFAFTPSESTWRRTSLLWGIHAFQMDLHTEDPEQTNVEAIRTLKDQGFVKSGETLVFASQIQARGEFFDAIQPRRVV